MTPERRLYGKVAMTTGASRGIGFAIWQRLAHFGADISIFAPNQEALRSAANVLERD